VTIFARSYGWNFSGFLGKKEGGKGASGSVNLPGDGGGGSGGEGAGACHRVDF